MKINLLYKGGYVIDNSELDHNTSQLMASVLNDGKLVTLDGAKPLHFQPALRWEGWDGFVVLVKDDENNEIGVMRGKCITQIIEGVYTLKCGGPHGLTVVAHDPECREALLKYAYGL